MPITIRQLLDDPQLKLATVYDGGGETLDNGVIWVHPTDVVNAAQYAEPGEILLTCSTNFPLESMGNVNDLSLLKRDLRKVGLPPSIRNPQEAYARLYLQYVADLSRAGVLAIGFGVGIKHDRIPQALIDAVRQHHMVLFEVPVEVNFSQIVKTVLRAQAEESENLQRVMYSAQRELFEASNAPEPIESVVGACARLTGGWAAFARPEGDIVAISNQVMHRQASDLIHQLIRARNQSGSRQKTMFGSAKSRGQYCVCAVEHDGALLGMIVVMADRTESGGALLRSVDIAAADALSCALPRRMDEYRMRSRLRSIVIEQIMGGQGESGAAFVGELWHWRLRFPVCVYCFECAHDDGRMLDLLDSMIADESIYGQVDGLMWIVAGHEYALHVERFVSDQLSDGEYGRAEAGSMTMLAEACREAQQNLRLCCASGRDGVVDMPAHELVSPGIAQLYAKELFSPLGTLTDDDRASLIGTLRTALATAFNVGATATRLGVHRHTVENRLGKLERLLGLDFSKESDRVKVWIACSFMRDDAMSTLR
ncbi:PucR family transcriptional regulator [Bifidobacterium sp. SO1]|uniref:PucR family transcriptional regulator n=1 Tax=Bifidobacterium sp. SO1 TaxID=2809029 RepID=UPI001BDC5F1A|nr:PucR family transcriptional regulator [Bifidobacterium sp. SO1]MBT1161523.1 PucR family transcriptional regulator [Bifidobacterium sp. SO1]